MTKNDKNTLDKKIISLSALLAVDAIIFPFLTGDTLHSQLGLGSTQDYKIWGERTLLTVQQALWGATMFYQVNRGFYKNENKQINSGEETYTSQ
jgi:hypothetical protein